LRKGLGYIFLLLVLIGVVYASFNVNLESPLDNIFLNYNDVNFTFNVTGNYSYYNCSIYTNHTGSWLLNSTNSSVKNYTSTPFTLNNLPEGGFIWNVYCVNATEENWSVSNYTFTVDTINPNWSNNVTSPSSGATYSTGVNYFFNVTWTDVNLDSVWIEHNFTGGSPQNDTNMSGVGDNYFYNTSNLAAGVYYWRMYANDSAGNLNLTYAFVYTVNKASSSVNLTLNGTANNFSINMGDSVNITGNLEVGEGILELYREGSLINSGSSPISNISVFNTPGTYNISVTYPATQNYSFGSETWWVHVNDTSVPNITFISPQNNSVISQTNVILNVTTSVLSTCQYILDGGSYDNITTNFITIHNITLTSLSDALHNITVNCTNQFSNSTVESISFTVDATYPGWSNNVSYPSSPLNYTGAQNYQFNVTWIDSNLDSVWIEHNFNGTLLNYTNVPNVSNVYFYNYTNLAAGTYQWRMFANDSVGNVNYTDAFVYTINRAASNVSLKLNGSSANMSIDEGDSVNITAVLITGEANIELYNNGLLINNGSSPLENITIFNTAGTYNITVNYPTTQNYTSDSETWWVIVNDTSAPVLTFVSPVNGSTTNETFVILNLTTDDSSTCQYFRNNGNYTNITTSYTTLHNITLTSLLDALHNITVNCTNQFSLDTVESISITVDTVGSSVVINYPTNNLTINNQLIELNFTLNESNPDSAWYTKNYNNTKYPLSSLSDGINLENISLQKAGWHILTLYVNDTSGYEAYDTVFFYLNLSINLTEWTNNLNVSLDDVDSVEPFNSTGDLITGNVSAKDPISLELNFTDISVNIYNFTGTYANWEYLFDVTDTDATFVSDVQAEGKNPVDYVYFKNFTKFFNQSNDYYSKVKLPNNVSAYTGIFYCNSSDASSCSEISPCSGSFTESTGTACYNNTADNVFVYVPHFSAVFGDNDTLQPVINITAPTNNSVVGQSYQIPLTFTVNEYSNCGYAINNGALTGLGWETTFSTNFNHYVNEKINVTVNCTDPESNTASSTINITINDVTDPIISETVTVTDDDVDIDFTTNEPTNYSVEIEGDTTSTYDETETSASWSTSHSESFNSIGDDDYDYTIIACDQLGNCETETGTFTVDTSADDEDTGGGGGGGGGSGAASSATTVSQVWQTPSKGQYLMNIPSTAIAFTEIDFTLKKDLTKNLLLTVQTRDLPSYIPELKDNKIFQYIKIDKYPIVDEDLSKVEIKFRVDKSWSNTNNIDINTVSLWRYTNKWVKLTTTKKTTDSNYIYYEVTSPGLSYFAIAGTEIVATSDTGVTEQNASTGSTPTGEAVEEVTTTEQQDQPEETTKKKKISGFIWIPLVILLLVVGAGAGFIYYQRNLSVQTDDELKSLRDYVERCKSEGIEFKHIRDTLVKAGWSESIIDLVLHDVDIPKKDMDQLLNYISVLRNKGKLDEDIKTNLRKAGWQEEVIEEAMKKAK